MVIEWDEYGFTMIDLRNVGHKDEPCVLAKIVAQVFYILDPKDEKKHIGVPGKQGVVIVNNMEMRKNTTNLTRCLSLWIQQG
jgi:hypothetical protein